MREAHAIIGKIIAGTATKADRCRLEHINCEMARSMKRQFTGFSRGWAKRGAKAKR